MLWTLNPGADKSMTIFILFIYVPGTSVLMLKAEELYRIGNYIFFFKKSAVKAWPILLLESF